MIRVAIVEDEMLVRLGLRMCLESSPDIYVAGAFASAEEAETGQDKAPVDVLLTDIRLPGNSGLELMRRLRKKYPQMLFVVLSCYDDFTYAQRAMEYGASRYILKHELDEKELPRILLELVQESRSAVSQEPEPVEDIPACAARLPACFREIGESIRLYTDKNCFAGGSDAFSDAAQLPRCIAQAKERAQGAFFYEQSHLFLQAASGERGCPALEFLYEDAFTTMWRAKTQAQLEAFFDACAKQKPAPDQIRETVMQFTQTMLRHGEFYYGLDRARAYGRDMDPSYRAISRIDSMQALARWLTQVIELTIRDVDSHQDLPHMIRTYLNEHYMQELQQTDVAAVFHMSGPYFSQYFKQSFGVNYVQYLNSLRIEKAKLLLVTTQNSTESIGELVGIPNVNYFFRLFKKTEGCTVREYRKRHTESKKVHKS